MRLSLKDFVLGVGEAFGEYLSLRDVIATHNVAVSNHYQSRYRDVAETVSSGVKATDTEPCEFR